MMPCPSACPSCNRPLRRSGSLIAGETVLRCDHCRKMAVHVEGMSTTWLDAGPGVVERLRQEAEVARIAKDIVESPDDDPRWVEIS